MKILFLTYQGDLAGSTLSIHYVSNGLAELGHEVYVGCREDSYLYSAVSAGSAVPVAMRFQSKLDLQTMKQIRDLVENKSIDIINAQSSKDRYLSIFSRKLYTLDTKIVHTRRQMPLMDAGKLQGWFYNTFTDKIIAVSHAVKRGLMDGGIKENQIHVIYNGTPKEKYEDLNTDRIGRLLKKYDIQDDELVVGCVSRRKKQDQLLESLSFVDVPVKVLFVGIDEDAFPEKYVGNVPSMHTLIFCGTVPFDEVLEYYKLFDVAVLPSTTEGLSQALLEAMALEIPVIATDAGGNSELIEDGENGFLYQDEDVKELGEKLQTLLQSENLRESIIKNAHTTAYDTFSIQNTVKNHEQFFSSLLSE